MVSQCRQSKRSHSTPPPPPWSASSARWPGRAAPPSRRPTGCASTPGPGPAARNHLWIEGIELQIVLRCAVQWRLDASRTRKSALRRSPSDHDRASQKPSTMDPKPGHLTSRQPEPQCRSALGTNRFAVHGITDRPNIHSSGLHTRGSCSLSGRKRAGSTKCVADSRCWARPGTPRTGCP